MIDYDLALTVIPGSNSRTMICFHPYGGNSHLVYTLKASGLIDATLVGFNFPDHDLNQKKYHPRQLVFGTIQELLPAFHVLKKIVIDQHLDRVDLYGQSAGGGALVNLVGILNSHRFSHDLQSIGIGDLENIQLLSAIQNGIVMLDVPLKSVEEIIDFRGTNQELEILARNYRENQLRPIDNLNLLTGLSLDILLCFQDGDTVLSNRDDALYIEKLKQSNQSGETSISIEPHGTHEEIHASLWHTYQSKLKSEPKGINNPNY